jgi:hypothetical protein
MVLLRVSFYNYLFLFLFQVEISLAHGFGIELTGPNLLPAKDFL